MTLTFTILGCGSSGGVPRPALGWGKCDPNNPKNRRRRCSLLVERHQPTPREPNAVTRLLVDTSPDLREQLIDANVDWLDGVLYTHEHADHTHGIDDLRALVIHKRRRVDVYAEQRTIAALNDRFGYCFRTPPGSEYPPILNERQITANQRFTIVGEGGPSEVLPFLQDHAEIPSLGFRFGALAYSCDLKSVPAQSLTALADLDVWILDALRFAPHPSHFNLDEALAWIERIKPRHAVLTNLHSDLDYEALRTKLPPTVEPAFDGMRLVLGAPR